MDSIRPRLCVNDRKKPMMRIECSYLHLMTKLLKMTLISSIDRYWLTHKRAVVVHN
jgi:hypothetical protein